MWSFADILECARKLKKKARVAIAPAYSGPLIEMIAGCDFITPIFLGDGDMLKQELIKVVGSSSGYEIYPVSDAASAIFSAVELAKSGKIDCLMQGKVSNTQFRDMVFAHDSGLLSGSPLSYISLLEYNPWQKLVMITDMLFNHSPSLKHSIKILEDAIALAQLLKIKKPRIAVLAPLEYVNISIPSTLHAAVLSKMGERKQLGDVIIDGPLDIDCAVSREAARRKGVSSKVSGDVDIFFVSDMESGFSFAQFLSFLGRMPMAGIVMGTRIPVILNMPFVAYENKIVEIALAILASHL